MQEAENIIRILKQAEISIKNKDVVKLKEISDQTIHTASITQDPDNIAIAVLIYTISKLIERGYDGNQTKCEKLCDEIIFSIKGIIIGLEKKDQAKLKNSLQQLRKNLDKVSEKFKIYIEDVLRKASINKASKIYEHGLSQERTASLLGITVWELANYSGSKQETSESKLEKTITTKSRIKLAMEIFK